MSGHKLEIGLLLGSTMLWLARRGLTRAKRDNDAGRNLDEPWPAGVARIFYFIGLPYVALLVGLISPRLLGLRGLEYFDFINWTSELWPVQLQQAGMLLLLTWLLDSRLLIPLGLAALSFFIALKVGLSRQGISFDARQPPLHAVYDGLHWAFYRAIFWSITGDPYLGVVLGAGFVMLERALGDRIGQQPGSRQVMLMNMIVLILTTSIFFYVPNLWLLLAVHLALVASVSNSPGVETASVAIGRA